jgi:hypothetical protein
VGVGVGVGEGDRGDGGEGGVLIGVYTMAGRGRSRGRMKRLTRERGGFCGGMYINFCAVYTSPSPLPGGVGKRYPRGVHLPGACLAYELQRAHAFRCMHGA